MPKIAVIVPVYNIEQYLARCIESILAQTFMDFEAILVDDGSPDRCGDICDEYAKKDARIKVIHQENQGQAAARNYAASQATAEYITFVDGDDMIHPQMLELLYSGIQSTGARIAMCREWEAEQPSADFAKEMHTTFRVLPINDNTLAKMIEDTSYVYWAPWPKLMDKSIFLDHPFTVGRIYEDSAVVFRWLCEAKTVADCDAKLYFYQVNNSGTTKKAFTEKRLDKLWSGEQQIEYYKTHGYTECLNILVHSYMFGACELCERVIDELDRRDLAKSIRKRALKIYKQCRDAVTISPYEHDRWMAVLYPIKTKIIWKLQSIFKKKGG